MPLLRRFSSLVALITTALLAACGIQPPPDPDAGSPDRLPIVVPFDFSKAGNSVEVDFRIIDMQRFRMSNTVYFGYLFITPDTPEGSRDLTALELASRSTHHPLRIELFRRRDTPGSPPVQLYISASPTTPDEWNGLRIPLPASGPYTRGTGSSDPGFVIHNDRLIKQWETRHFALAPDLQAGRYRVRIRTTDGNPNFANNTALIIYHQGRSK